MRQSVKGLVLVAALCIASVVSAASWPQLQSRLEQWQGEKEVVLPVGVDPFEDEVLAPVLDLLLEQGYVILPGDGSSSKGLTIELRDTSHGQRLLLKRAADGALLAMEKLVAPPVAAPVVLSTSAHVQPQALKSVAAPAPQAVRVITTTTRPTQLSVQQPPQPAPAGEVLFELEGAPLQIVSWPLGAGKQELYLLYDSYIQRVSYDGRSLQLLDKFSAPIKSTRALHLDLGDMNNDGIPELAVVWAEDVRGVADATNTVLHSWLLSSGQQGLRVVSADLGGYLSLAENGCYLQKRSPYKPFAPAIYRVTMDGNKVAISDQPVEYQERLLFNQLQWPDSERALVWNDEQRLMLVARSKDTRIPGSTLLTDFGLYRGATVSVPLREPEYRSGFSANDRVMAHDFVLNRRMVRAGDGVYTIVRGRSEGLPLVGRPNGSDALVKICNQGDTLSVVYPFARVDAYIVDFSLEDGVGSEAAVLLNEKADGSGRAYLRLQKAL
ncbi:MAG: hypothetical protein B6I36_04005 [Desulfobacteraceae bacterium 4572_35.1]|nr:MAG: hypothetical protein B6I36_04005 [Desulfobacteraceae bacterium 4572_35.1]